MMGVPEEPILENSENPALKRRKTGSNILRKLSLTGNKKR